MAIRMTIIAYSERASEINTWTRKACNIFMIAEKLVQLKDEDALEVVNAAVRASRISF